MDGLAVIPKAEGARLRCVFQRLECEATRDGLWLTSTVTNAANDRFRIVATAVGRLTNAGNQHAPFISMSFEEPPGFGLRQPSGAFQASAACPKPHGTPAVQEAMALAHAGKVEVADKLVRFLRPGVIEEYTVSMDGVRQDFIIEHPPLNSQLSTLNQRDGELAVWLAVSSAKVEPAVGGVRLVLENSGRKIAYSRLHVTDATGKELPARMEVTGSTAAPAVPVNASLTGGTGANVFDEGVEHNTRGACAPMLAVLVNDADAVYPVRIDPTFSDANWISLGGIPGADSKVRAAVVDGSGNLYSGGDFLG